MELLFRHVYAGTAGTAADALTPDYNPNGYTYIGDSSSFVVAPGGAGLLAPIDRNDTSKKLRVQMDANVAAGKKRGFYCRYSVDSWNQSVNNQVASAQMYGDGGGNYFVIQTPTRDSKGFGDWGLTYSYWWITSAVIPTNAAGYIGQISAHASQDYFGVAGSLSDADGTPNTGNKYSMGFGKNVDTSESGFNPTRVCSVVVQDPASATNRVTIHDMFIYEMDDRSNIDKS